MEQKQNTIGYTENEDFRCLEDLQDYRFEGQGSDMCLDYCGMERCKPGWSFGPYVRQNYVLHIIIEGKGSLYMSEGREYHLQKNEAFLLRPGEESVYTADEEQPWVYAWVGFHGYQAETIVSSMGFVQGQKDAIRVADAVVLTGYISNMLDCREMTFSNSLKRRAWLALLVSDIMDAADVPEKTEIVSEETYVHLAIEEIIGHYDQPVKVAHVARKIGINRSYLSIIFKKRMGVSPQQFLINYRMEQASRLLSQTAMTIRTVAAAVGYTDPLTFSKAFKQKYGVSPSIYRQQPMTVSHNENKGDYTGHQNL